MRRLMEPSHGISRSLCVIATGGGKTIVFASLLDRLLPKRGRALVLAHREELLTQARDKIAMVAPSLHVEIEQAQKKASKQISEWTAMLRSIDRTVVVASVQTLRGKRLKSWKPDTFDVIIVDEAHHATAKTYVDIFEHFGCMKPGGTRLVGVTATPGRSDGVGLGFVFQEIAVEYGIRELIGMGYLSRVKARRVASQISLEGVRTAHGDFVASDLEARVDVSERNELIVSAYEQYAAGDRAIVFCAGVSHAHHIAELFRARGIEARPVWGDMAKPDRSAILAAYQAGTVPVLTNFGVLTEGFDAPETRCIILARPTKSSLVVTQCIGRGTRLAPGKESCLVLDVRDTVGTKNLCSAATLAGLPPNFDPQGGDVLALAEDLEELDPRLVPDALDAEKLGEMVQKVKKGMTVEEIDIFAAIRVDPLLRERSPLAWRQTGQDAWAIRAADTNYAIHVDTLGRFVMTCGHATIAIERTPEKAFAFVDALIRSRHPEAAELLDLSKPWRKKPASQAQLDFLSKQFKGQDLPKNLSKGDASLLIASKKR